MFISELYMSKLDRLSHYAATSPLNNLSEPTEAQKKSGNYKKGHIKLYGMNISIENPIGSYRSGIDPDGNSWKQQIHHHYGYICNTKGKDKDHLDVFINPYGKSDKIVIINQANIKTGEFDEHKIMINFDNFADAIKNYLKNYDKEWEQKGGIRSAYMISLDEFRNWLKNGNTTTEFKGVPKE